MNLSKSIFLLILIISIGCAESPESRIELKKDLLEKNEVDIIKGEYPYVSGYSAMNKDGSINVVVEIPAGTLEKWEVVKENETMQLEQIEGKPRIIEYLGYPGNYGMIPQTILPKAQGGDGDPLDILVIGPPAKRGSVVPCELIGVLHLLDRGEMDDKLIALSLDCSLDSVMDIKDLQNRYPGITDIIEIWFENYKGVDKMESLGYSNKTKAMEVLDLALAAYESKLNQK